MSTRAQPRTKKTLRAKSRRATRQLTPVRARVHAHRHPHPQRPTSRSRSGRTSHRSKTGRTSCRASRGSRPLSGGGRSRLKQNNACERKGGRGGGGGGPTVAQIAAVTALGVAGGLGLRAYLRRDTKTSSNGGPKGNERIAQIPQPASQKPLTATAQPANLGSGSNGGIGSSGGGAASSAPASTVGTSGAARGGGGGRGGSPAPAPAPAQQPATHPEPTEVAELAETARREQQIIDVFNTASAEHNQISQIYNDKNAKLQDLRSGLVAIERQLLAGSERGYTDDVLDKEHNTTKKAIRTAEKELYKLEELLEKTEKTKNDAGGVLHNAELLKKQNMNNECIEKIKCQNSTLLHARCFPMFEGTKVVLSTSLGTGNYGSVWDVNGPGNGKIVVKKQEGFCYTFINEIKCLERLKDTGIVPRIYDAYICIDAKEYGYVMDKLDVTLLTFINKKPTSAEIQNVGGQIFNCLNILDAEGILHRDFNLNNIMLKRQPDNTHHVYIIDFGLSYDKRDKSSVTSFVAPLGEISQLRFYQDNVEHDQNYVWFKTQTMTALTELNNRGELKQLALFTELFRILSNLHGDKTNWYVI